VTLYPPLWAGGLSYAAGADRRLLNALFQGGGVLDLAGTDLKVQQRAAGANMSVDIQPGTGIVTGTDGADQGRYLCTSNAVENRTVNAAPGAGTSRIDRIYARVQDADILGGSSSWTLNYLAGTAAASPAVPALPASSIPLARFTVLSSTTQITSGMIQDDRQLAGVAGGAGSLFGPSVDVAGSTTFTTPTGNFILGTGGTKYANYYKLGRLVCMWCTFILGTSGNVTFGGTIQISLPFACTTSHRGFAAAKARQNAGLVVSGTAAIGAGSSIVTNFVAAGNDASWDATTPFNWDVGDSFDAIIIYEAVA
jgi:hypothetical protein